MKPQPTDRSWRRNRPPSGIDLLLDEGGATLVEIAVTLPIFFLLVFGLINFALLMFGLCNVSYASRAGARYACQHSATSNPDTTISGATTTAATASTVNSLVSRFIYAYPANTSTTSITYGQAYGGSSGNLVGNSVAVTVTITYTLVMPLFTYHVPTLSSTSGGIIVQ